MILVDFLIFGVLIGYGTGDSSWVVAPNNTVAASGSRMLLQCITAGNESFVREWTLRRTLDQSVHLIFSHWNNEAAAYTIAPGFSHFGAQVDESGSAVLYTNHSKIEDAGLYTCLVEVKKATLRYSAQVVILQTIPDCVFQRTENRIKMKCAVAYRGNMVPALQWRVHRQQGDAETTERIVTEGIHANTVAGSSISSTLTVAVIPSKDDIYYTCRVFFTVSDSSNSSGESKLASNDPEFHPKWTSPVVKGQSTTTDDFAMGRNSDGVTQPSEPTNWFVISLALGAVMLGVFVLMATITSVLCYRMKRKTLQAEKRATVETHSNPGEMVEKHLSKEASAQNTDYDYEVMLNDGYEKIGDLAQDSSLDNQSHEQLQGYGNLLPPHKRETVAYFQINQKDMPVQYKKESTDPMDPGQAYYLTLQDSAEDCVTPPVPDSHYLALLSSTTIVGSAENRSSDYLN